MHPLGGQYWRAAESVVIITLSPLRSRMGFLVLISTGMVRAMGESESDPAARLSGMVRERRGTAGWTQRQLADAAGVSLGVVRDLEQGISRRPHPGSVERLAAALGITTAESSAPTVVPDGLAGADVGLGGALRLQVLGPLEACRDGTPVPLGGGKQKAVLGLLALHPGAMVSLDAIGDAVWGAEPPPTAPAMIQLLRTTLLPGLLRVLARNAGRGFSDVALFEVGLVFRPRPESPGMAPILRVDRGPTEQEVASLEAALPDQPLRVAAVLAGDRELPGWWGPGRPAAWPDIIEAAREVLRASRGPFEVRSDQHEPWHPGRCAALFVQAADGRERLAGHAGEVHPRVTAAFDLAPRTCAMELDLTVIETAAATVGPAQAPVISPYPVATQDVALVVPE